MRPRRCTTRKAPAPGQAAHHRSARRRQPNPGVHVLPGSAGPQADTSTACTLLDSPDGTALAYAENARNQNIHNSAKHLSAFDPMHQYVSTAALSIPEPTAVPENPPTR